jgi:hypothetical protein
VLKEKGEAMHYADIADTIVKEKLRDKVGATMWQRARFDIKPNGKAS